MAQQKEKEEEVDRRKDGKTIRKDGKTISKSGQEWTTPFQQGQLKTRQGGKGLL